MTEAPGGSAGFGHGSDPEEHEALLRRIREFLRHGAAAEAGVEEWGEFAAQLRFLREELPPEERQALLERWDRVLLRRLGGPGGSRPTRGRLGRRARPAAVGLDARLGVDRRRGG